MSQEKTNRVLGRTGARQLSEQECEQVAGGIHTSVCTIQGCNQDGDCPVPIGCPPAGM